MPSQLVMKLNELESPSCVATSPGSTSENPRPRAPAVGLLASADRVGIGRARCGNPCSGFQSAMVRMA